MLNCNTITTENIMDHILKKKKELEQLEELNNQMMREAVSRAQSGGRSRALTKFKAKLAKNSAASSPSVSPVKDHSAYDFTNAYVANRPKSKNVIEHVENDNQTYRRKYYNKAWKESVNLIQPDTDRDDQQVQSNVYPPQIIQSSTSNLALMKSMTADMKKDANVIHLNQEQTHAKKGGLLIEETFSQETKSHLTDINIEDHPRNYNM